MQTSANSINFHDQTFKERGRHTYQKIQFNAGEYAQKIRRNCVPQDIVHKMIFFMYCFT
jgi:hypothetical protein